MRRTNGAGGRRHHHHHHHGGARQRRPSLCLESSSPDDREPRFKQVKPRVGSQYQTRVPRMGTISTLVTRPAPERMSTDFPHLTETEVKEGQSEGTASTWSSSSVTLSPGYGPMQYDQPPRTSRGGLCVHRPITNDDDDGFLSTLRSNDNQDELLPTRKRKLDNKGETTNKKKRARRPGEEEHFLEFLTLRHQGNVETAQLAFKVASSAGRAYKERRCLQKEFRVQLAPTSQSWMERFDHTICSEVNASLSTTAPVPTTSAAEKKRVWKDVLQQSQEMVRELDSGRKHSLLLSEVIAFVNKARNLPYLPEDTFGSRHVVVEGISENMHAILNHVSTALDAQAKLYDLLFDESNEGVELEAVNKFVEENTVSLRLDEMDVLETQLELATQWQACMECLDEDTMGMEDRNDLIVAEELLRDASSHGIRWRGHVQLATRVEKAHQLRDRLKEWQQSCLENKKESFKFVSVLVRDANRLNLNFPEVSELIKFHQTAESWIERANVAVRSRIALTEIESLINRAEKLPLDLSELTDKLQNRMRLSQSWLSHFQDFVPAPFQDGKVDNLAWMARMREALLKNEKSFMIQLQDLANEGTRIPVDIDCVKLLLVEIDAKNWSLKAKKWIPIPSGVDGDSESGGRRAKLVDIRDHLTKADALRERLVLSPGERDSWVLEGEAELKAIIEAADEWYEQYQEYLEFDNRRCQERSCLAIATLRQIVDEGNLIHANIGTSFSKMSRILGQAEEWHEKFGDLLVRCGVSVTDASEATPGLVTLEEIHDAVEHAASNVSLDLDEAIALRDLGERIQKWQDQVVLAAPKRSQRVGKGKRGKVRFSVDDLLALIDEASSLPTQTDEDVARLKQQLNKVHECRLCAQHELGEIATGFRTLQQTVNSVYGLPHEFSHESDSDSEPDKAVEAYEPVAEESRADVLTDGIVNSSVENEERPSDAVDAAKGASQTDAMAEIPSVAADAVESSCQTDANNEIPSDTANAVGVSCQTVVMAEIPSDTADAVESSCQTDANDEIPSVAADAVESSCQIDANDEMPSDAAIAVEESSQTDATSTAESEVSTEENSGGAIALHKKITLLVKASKLTGIRTNEEELAEQVERVAKWVLRSLKCIDSPNEVYEKKTFRPFNEFIEAGGEFLAISESLEDEMELDGADLMKELSSSWGALVSDQLVRLKTLQAHRNEFISWARKAKETLSSKENRVTMETLRELAEQSHDYPCSSDIVQKVRHAFHRASNWKGKAGTLFSSDEKPMMRETRELFEEGEKLNLACDELKVLRSAIRSARGWATRVKRSKLDQGGANVKNVNKLIDEYDSLQIAMPDELSKLAAALKGYCLCRQPYDGFMVGCDGCGEWYHGPCIGLTAAQADRREKFLCVRCCVKRVFRTSAESIASTIRKWTDPKDLKKARQYDAQKHQRKVRKEKRDIEKLTVETESLATELGLLKSRLTPESGSPKLEEGTAVSPSSQESADHDASTSFKENANTDTKTGRAAMTLSEENQSVTAKTDVSESKPREAELTENVQNGDVGATSTNRDPDESKAQEADLTEIAQDTAVGASSTSCDSDQPEARENELTKDGQAHGTVGVSPTSLTNHNLDESTVREAEQSKEGQANGTVGVSPTSCTNRDSDESTVREAEQSKEGQADGTMGVSPTSCTNHNSDESKAREAEQSKEGQADGTGGVSPTSFTNHSSDESKVREDEQTEKTQADGAAGGSSTNHESVLTREQEIEAQLSKAAESVKACGDRLDALAVVADKRKEAEDREDEKKAELRRWCIRVRSLVLAPSAAERAAASLPSTDGSLSPPMLQVIKDATTLGIEDLADVAEVENSFKCIAWCCFAMNLLARRPSFNEVNSIVSKCSCLKLPEEKSVRMMKSMLQRARFWHAKVGKALAPKPGETEPVNVNALKGLMEAASDIPLSLPGEACVQNVIDDKGTRYCVCGGPHYGSFMVGCDQCERWYHGRCVEIKKQEGEALDMWLCPPCLGVPTLTQHSFGVEDMEVSDDEDDMSESDREEEDISTYAPVPEKLWPPFGLIPSATAKEALGEVCCAIEDDTVSLVEENSSRLPTETASTSCDALPTLQPDEVMSDVTVGSMTMKVPAMGSALAAADVGKVTEVDPVKDIPVSTEPVSTEQQCLTESSSLNTPALAPTTNASSDESAPSSNGVSTNHEASSIPAAQAVQTTNSSSDESAPSSNGVSTNHEASSIPAAQAVQTTNASSDESASSSNGVSTNHEASNIRAAPTVQHVGHDVDSATTEVLDEPNGTAVFVGSTKLDIGQLANGNVPAPIVNVSLQHANPVQIAAEMARVQTTPAAYSMDKRVSADSCEVVKADEPQEMEIDTEQLPEETRGSHGFDGMMAETMVTVPDGAS